MKQPRGFTLIELLLSIGLITILAAISAPVYASFQARSDLNTNVFGVVSAFRRAQNLAQGSNGDSNWGVYLQSGSFTIYKGATYAARDVTYDEVTSIPTSTSFSGLTEVNFTKFTGETTTPGTSTLTTNTSLTQTVAVTVKGMITY